MGGLATQPTVQLSPRWYVRRIEIERAESGFADSKFLLQVAFGDYRPEEVDPVTGAQLFDTWGTKVVTVTGAQLFELLQSSSMPQEEQQALLTVLLTADAQITAACDQLLATLKTLGRFDDTAMPKL